MITLKNTILHHKQQFVAKVMFNDINTLVVLFTPGHPVIEA